MCEPEKTVDGILARLLINAYKIEEKMINTNSENILSISELHVLREIGIGEPKTMTQVAKGLKISVGALTTAMNKLESKGYVHRKRDDADKRIVHISLTDIGVTAFENHEDFHKNMIIAAMAALTEEEKDALLKSLTKLDKWFIDEWNKIPVR
jgi:DNA-binding MarR family transcriptional regulator